MNFVEHGHEELVAIRNYPPFELEAKIAIFMDEADQYQVRRGRSKMTLPGEEGGGQKN